MILLIELKVYAYIYVFIISKNLYILNSKLFILLLVLTQIASDEDLFESFQAKHLDDIYSFIRGFSSLIEEDKIAFFEAFSEIIFAAIDISSKSTNLSIVSRNNIKTIFFYSEAFFQKAENILKENSNNAISGLITDSEDKITDTDGDNNTKVIKNKSNKTKKSSKSSASFVWSESRKTFLDIFDSILSINPSNLWRMCVISENFLAGIWSQVIYILETRPIGIAGSSSNEINIRNFCVSLIIKCISHFNISGSGSFTNLTTAIIDSLIKYESMSVYVATICINCQSTLIADVMKEIGSMKMSTMQTKSVNNIGSFIEALAKGSPSLMTTYMPIIKHQVDSGAHQIRSSILHAMGLVISYIHKSSELNHHVDNNNEEVEEDVAEVNIIQLNRTRDSLLDIIVERAHDISHYTRSTVLKVFVLLLESYSIPVRRIGTIGAIAVDRLIDKTTIVRKGAVSLLTSLLENNPFSSSLDIHEFEKQKEDLIVKLADRIEYLRVNSAKNDDDNDNTIILTPSKLKKQFNDDANDMEEDDKDDEEENNEIIEEDLFLQSADVLEDSEFISIKAQIDYCEGGLNLIKAMATAMPKIEEMLKSKNSSDVIEGLKFFTKAVNFSIKGSAKYLRSAFSLIWHDEEIIRLECLNSFKNVYLTDGGDAEDVKALNPLEIATNLIQLCKRCNISELVSFEHIIGDLFQKEQVDKLVLSSLWSIIQESQESLKSDENTDIINDKSEDLSSLLCVIAMIGKYLPNTLSANRIRAIVQISFNKNVLNRKHYNVIKAGAQCLNAAIPYFSVGGRIVEEDMQLAYNVAAPALRDAILGIYLIIIYLMHLSHWYSIYLIYPSIFI